jgi:hypothetical protein
MAVTSIPESQNGVGSTGSQTSWTAARNATSAGASNYTSAFSRLSAIEVYRSARGSVVYGVTRTFFFFDLSSLPSGNIISAIDLKVTGYGSGFTGDGNVRVARATAFGGNGLSTYATTDFDNWSPSSPTPYASNLSTWSNVAINTITLNATAISDANTNGYLNLVLVDNLFDYPDTAPTINDFNTNGIAFRSSTSENVVEVTHAAAPGWEDIINGVGLKFQQKINGVLISDISSVNGTS